MNEAFRIRAKRTIIELLQRRNYLIRACKSKNDLTLNDCEILHERLMQINSDASIATYIVRNYKKLILLPPAVHFKSLDQLRDLLKESYQYTNER